MTSVRGDVQPHEAPSWSARSAAESPSAKLIAPSRSNDSPRDTGVRDGSQRQTNASSARPTGTFARNTACHENASVSQPASTGPELSPTYVATARMPSARPRSPRGNVATRMAVLAGNSIAAPTPWIPRATTSGVMAGASPAAAAPAMKMTNPASSTGRYPRRSPIRPKRSRRLPPTIWYTTSARLAVPTSVRRSVWITGRTAATPLADSVVMKFAAQSAARTSHLGSAPLTLG